MARITRGERVQAVLFLVIGVTLTLGLLLVLFGFPFTGSMRTYYTVFGESVAGIDKGAAVRVKGVRVGKVASVKLQDDAVTGANVRVTLEIDPDVFISTETRASISLSGILGPYFISLAEQKAGGRSVPPGTTIPSVPSALSSLLRAGSDIGTEITEILREVKLWLAPDNRKNFETLMANAEDVTQSLKQAAESIDRLSGLSYQVVEENRQELHMLMTDAADVAAGLKRFVEAGELQQTTQDAQDAFKTLRRETVQLTENLNAWLADNRFRPQLEAAVEQVRLAREDLHGLIGTVERETVLTTREGLQPTLRQLSITLRQLTTFLEQIGLDPSQIIFGEPRPEIRLDQEEQP